MGAATVVSTLIFIGVAHLASWWLELDQSGASIHLHSIHVFRKRSPSTVATFIMRVPETPGAPPFGLPHYASPVGASWVCTLALGHHEDRRYTAMQQHARTRWRHSQKAGGGNK